MSGYATREGPEQSTAPWHTAAPGGSALVAGSRCQGTAVLLYTLLIVMPVVASSMLSAGG
jgi:hypothetical protein